ncbi:unnamed protein product [Meganyctiphanes norvegica]|uniref:Uncharacterized protein n=1 Tax=Meganyctiphanes norvegica TaxID=48144 RepID=A0AAV2PNI4_MEGNR
MVHLIQQMLQNHLNLPKDLDHKNVKNLEVNVFQRSLKRNAKEKLIPWDYVKERKLSAVLQINLSQQKVPSQRLCHAPAMHHALLNHLISALHVQLHAHLNHVRCSVQTVREMMQCMMMYMAMMKILLMTNLVFSTFCHLFEYNCVRMQEVNVSQRRQQRNVRGK